ncbi:MAG: ABC transporter substrate-binding protein [Desulfobacterales bacterium]|nr:MAG: ABC transporter substrate-binding protein [Desulfobacterales bacterium]
MKTGTFIRVILILAVIMTLATWGADNTQAASLTKITVAVPHPSAINWIPLHVAIGQGYFKDEGLEVNVEAVDGSSQVLQAMSAGRAQIGAPGPGPVLSARARGVDVVFIYNLYPKALFGLVVKKASSYNMAGQLKGKVIGVGTADGSEVTFVRPILAEAGMVEGKDYEFLPVGDGGLAAAAFERGDIEAYAAAVPDAAIMESRGLRLREITPEKFLSYFGNGFAALNSYMKENPKVIEGFGRAIVRAANFCKVPANREKVLADAKKGNPQEGEDTALANALLDKVLERQTPLDLSPGWGYQPTEGWKLWHEGQIESGALKGPLPNLEAAYTNDFIKIWNGK